MPWSTVHSLGRGVQRGLLQCESLSAAMKVFSCTCEWKCVPLATCQSTCTALKPHTHTHTHTNCHIFTEVKRVSHFLSVWYHYHYLCHAHSNHLEPRKSLARKYTANCPTINKSVGRCALMCLMFCTVSIMVSLIIIHLHYEKLSFRRCPLTKCIHHHTALCADISMIILRIFFCNQ